jgi:hypothetical protein
MVYTFINITILPTCPSITDILPVFVLFFPSTLPEKLRKPNLEKKIYLFKQILPVIVSLYFYCLTDVTPPNDISIKIVGYENT